MKENNISRYAEKKENALMETVVLKVSGMETERIPKRCAVRPSSLKGYPR